MPWPEPARGDESRQPETKGNPVSIEKKGHRSIPFMEMGILERSEI
ncbi:hypothetical protein ES705_10129 [subsurface metagenome]